MFDARGTIPANPEQPKWRWRYSRYNLSYLEYAASFDRHRIIGYCEYDTESILVSKDQMNNLLGMTCRTAP